MQAVVSSNVPGSREQSLPVDAIFGPYRIVRTLGSGSFGAVYEALQNPLGKRVALKVLHGHLAAQGDTIHRFHREAQALVRLRHPHVVDVFDLGEFEGRPFIAMEYLEGESLAARMARIPVMTLAALADLMIPVCVAVGAAHDLEIVHRDLKPDNIFIAHMMGADHPKLLDFGIAKVALPDEAFGGTATSAILGTPHYMAPEQVRSTRDVTAQADQWALAVILWEALTGRKPFVGESLFDVLQNVVSQPLPRLASLRPDLPPAVAAAVQQALSREPEQRLPSVRHLGLALLPIASERTRFTFSGPLQPSPRPSAANLSRTLEVTSASLPPIVTEQASSVELPLRYPPRARRRAGLGWALAAGAAVVVGVGGFAIIRGGPADEPATTAHAEPPHAAAPPPRVEVRRPDAVVAVAPPVAPPAPPAARAPVVPAAALAVAPRAPVAPAAIAARLPPPDRSARRRPDVAPAAHARADYRAAPSMPLSPSLTAAPAPAPAPAAASSSRSGGLNASEF
jgi:serine/threonine protein kinase